MTLIKSISGIRGTIGGSINESLTPFDIVKFSSAFASWLHQKTDKKTIVVGRDARLSGEMVSNLISSTFIAMGFDVVDLGLSTTPTVEIAVTDQQAAGGVIITASHNPMQWNALKLLNENGEFISAKDGQDLLEIIDEAHDFVGVNKLGKLIRQNDYIDIHIEKILNLDLVDIEAIKNRKFKIAVDAVNSTGGIAVPRLLKALGVDEVTEFYCEPTGHFPHNPEPLPDNITHICNEIDKGKFDLGIVVDPDVDRLALICEDGVPFGEEYTLVSVADYVLKNNPGNTVSNLSSTRALKDITIKNGGTYLPSAVGEVNVVEKMKECDAVIGGEGNGGIIYPVLHYGRDALVGIALFLSHLAHFGKSASMLRSTYPNYHISKNKIELTPALDVDKVLSAVKEKYKKSDLVTIDGVKINFERDWVHLRKSNTEPIIRIYSESDTQATAEHLANKIISDIKEFINNK